MGGWFCLVLFLILWGFLFVCVFSFGWFFTYDVKDLLKVTAKQLGCF